MANKYQKDWFNNRSEFNQPQRLTHKSYHQPRELAMAVGSSFYMAKEDYKPKEYLLSKFTRKWGLETKRRVRG